ncbi:MAG: hypothetical protein KBG48_28880 [Kofleriaceae bacterium]|jgi:hypothetical protein|nr:hypothetical protein [Kofleriaceae bacterium]MBP9171447.1 hypothetical protein [Kofleriaceae bacterium]MBP9862559.1 hypothetical protein [Kofleriaceae bacterium]
MFARLASLALGALAAVGCDEPTLTCVEVDLTCAPLYAPTWDNLVTTTLLPSCAAAGCHTRAAAAGGLILDDPATAYARLQPYVTPGDVACSELTMRVFAGPSSLLMPRGARLSEAEACAVAQWVAAGAPGPVTAAGAP